MGLWICAKDDIRRRKYLNHMLKDQQLSPAGKMEEWGCRDKGDKLNMTNVSEVAYYSYRGSWWGYSRQNGGLMWVSNTDTTTWCCHVQMCWDSFVAILGCMYPTGGQLTCINQQKTMSWSYLCSNSQGSHLAQNKSQCPKCDPGVKSEYTIYQPNGGTLKVSRGTTDATFRRAGLLCGVVLDSQEIWSPCLSQLFGL